MRVAQAFADTTVRGKKRHDGRPRAIRSRWRRRLKRWLPRKKCGRQWQIETVFSMVKRNLDSALTARKRYSPRMSHPGNSGADPSRYSCSVGAQ